MCSAWAEAGVRSAPKQCVGEAGRNKLLVGLEPGGKSCRALTAAILPGGAWQSVKGLQLSVEFFSWQDRQKIRCNAEKAGARKALHPMEDGPGIAVRWQRCLMRNFPRFARNCGRSRKRRTERCGAEVGDSASASPESSNGRESEPSDVEEEFERWSRGQLASVLARDTEFSVDMGRSDPWDSDSDQENSVDMRRSDPWDSDSDQEDTPSTSGHSNLPGEVSLEAASVLGGTKLGASFPFSSSALPAEMSGLTDEPIKVEVEAQDASQKGMSILRLLAEMEKRKQAQKARAKELWLQSFIHEASSMLLFAVGWLRTAFLAGFQFLKKQPGELFNLSWPTPAETVSTMGLVTGTIMVLLVLISTMDTGFTFVLASLVRRSAQ